MDGLSVDAAYTRSLPKIELHAHLTGSITPQTLHSIWLHLKEANADLALADPLEELSPEKAWNIQTFFPLFSSYIYALISTRETIIWSTKSVLYDFWADGVVYLELRTTPRSAASMSKRSYVETILECIEDFEHKQSMPTRLILSVDRRNTIEEALEVVDLALELHNRDVVGVDLCGDPSKGDVLNFAPAFVKAKEAGLKITLHFAETPGSSSFTELGSLLSFQPDRLGHVICVPETIRKEIGRRRLGVELCISCNVKAGLTKGGVGGHHFGSWKNRGVPVILCVSQHPLLSSIYISSDETMSLIARRVTDRLGRPTTWASLVVN